MKPFRQWAIGTTVLFALPLLAISWIVPEYLLHRGFPLDDSWIHMVYGRSLACEGMLSYNPGLPTTGETSPLWAVVLAIPHGLGLSLAGRVLWVKGTGWLLHTAGAVFMGRALLPIHKGVACLAGLAILLHPELAAAAVSGMEVPLAEMLLGLQVWAVFGGHARLFALAAVLAPWGRPEIGIFAPMLGFLCAPGGSLRARLRWGGLGLALAGLGYLLMFGRCYRVSGSLLPATFHVKANAGFWRLLDSMAASMAKLLPSLLPLPSLGLLGLVLGMGCAACWLLYQRQEARPILAGLAGVLLVGVCGALVFPRDVPAFYHRRYLLVGLPLLLTGMAGQGAILVRRLPVWVGVVLASGWIGFLLLLWPARFHHLDNDAHNIDDVQVAVGKTLARFPAALNFWAVDAGAVRYFGKPFVVDTIGLNTPEIHGAAGAAFLAAHPAGATEVVAGWNALALSPADMLSLQFKDFAPTTAYSVTSFKQMAVHRLVIPTRPVSGRLLMIRQVHAIHLVAPIMEPR